MKDTTRRGFLATAGAGAAAVGATTLIPGAASAATAAAPATAAAAPAAPATHLAGPLVAHIADAATGTVAVMVGEREVVVHDPALVARLVEATR